MRSTCMIKDDGALASQREAKTDIVERGFQTFTGIGTSPCHQSGIADASKPDIGSLSLRPFPRCLPGDRATTIKQACPLHGFRSIVASILEQCLVDSPIVLPGDERQAAFVLDEPADFLTSRILMR